MEMTKKGNYKLEDWSLKDIECTGESAFFKKHRPCHSKFTLHDGDIVQRYFVNDEYNREVQYGFICDECHLFTKIDSSLIPTEIRVFCPQVASKCSEAYSELSDEEKELSKYL